MLFIMRMRLVAGEEDPNRPVDYKISGSAFKQLKAADGRPRFLHHGTLLFDTDFSALGRYLTPSKVKLQLCCNKVKLSFHGRVSMILLCMPPPHLPSSPPTP